MDYNKETSKLYNRMDITNRKSELKEKIEYQLKKMIVEVIGDDFISIGEIQTNSKLAEDLEMESIEIVQFADLVKTEFGDRVDLTLWMSSMELTEIINLKLQDILDFLFKELYNTNQSV